METDKKASDNKTQIKDEKKPTRRKKASWAKNEKTANKKTEKLVMVETKDAPKKSSRAVKSKTTATKKINQKSGSELGLLTSIRNK